MSKWLQKIDPYEGNDHWRQKSGADRESAAEEAFPGFVSFKSTAGAWGSAIAAVLIGIGLWPDFVLQSSVNRAVEPVVRGILVLVGLSMHGLSVRALRNVDAEIERGWSYLQEKIPELESEKPYYAGATKYLPVLSLFVIAYTESSCIKEARRLIMEAADLKLQEVEEFLNKPGLDSEFLTALEEGSSSQKTAVGLEPDSDLLTRSEPDSQFLTTLKKPRSSRTVVGHIAVGRGPSQVIEDWKRWKQASKEEREEMDYSKPSVEEAIETYREVDRALALANRQAELLEELEPIEGLIEADLPEEMGEAAAEKLETARRRIAQGEFDEARKAAEQAEHKARASVDYLIDSGDELADHASTSHGQGHYEDAIDAWKRAIHAYDRAASLAPQIIEDEQVLTDHEESTGTKLREARLGLLESMVERASTFLDGQYATAEEEFEDFLDTIEDADLDGEQFDALERRAKEGHLEAKVQQGWERIERARNRYRERDYHAAREAFQDAKEYLETVLSLASVYAFTERKEKIARLVQLCTENADRARRALYDTGQETPELATLEDVGSVETPPSRSADSGPRPTVRPEQRSPSIRVADDDRLQKQLPEYETIERIGSGANADVHKVRLADSGEVVALKIPRWQGTLSMNVIEQFTDEAETWSRLDEHEHIVDVIDWGTTPHPWMLLEYMPSSLRAEVRSEQLDPTEKLETLIAIAEALKHAHGRGIIHLDIKPENVLFDARGTPKVADWGLARVLLDHTRTQMGLTPPYSAPEQLTERAGDLDHWTDVYQLGVLSYEFLTGRLPFESERPADLRRQILDDRPVSPSEVNPVLSTAADEPILRALSKAPDERYERVIQFRDDLRRLRRSITSS